MEIDGMSDPQGQFEQALSELAALTTQRDTALEEINRLGAGIKALSTAIAVTSSALNAPEGLTCALRPAARLNSTLGGVLGAGLLMELSLFNSSPLALTGNWSLVVAQMRDSAVVHAAALPPLAPGGRWDSTFILEPSTLSPCDLCVFLSCEGGGETNSHAASPSLALLHVFKIDAVHALRAATPAGTGGQAPAAQQDLRQLLFQRMGIKLGLPKAMFGLEPPPAAVLEALVSQGDASLPAALPAPTDPVPGSNKKAALRGELLDGAGGSQPAALTAQLAPATAASAASSHAALELSCEAEGALGCLALHEATLRRVQRLQGVAERCDTSGIKFPNGVLVAPLCSSADAGLDTAELEAIETQLEGLKEAATALRAAAASGGDGAAAGQLHDLVRRTRDMASQLMIEL